MILRDCATVMFIICAAAEAVNAASLPALRRPPVAWRPLLS
jgi:hypothetical protein